MAPNFPLSHCLVSQSIRLATKWFWGRVI